MTLARWPSEGLNSAAYASSILAITKTTSIMNDKPNVNDRRSDKHEKKQNIKRSRTPDRPGPVSGASLPSQPDVLGDSLRSTAEATGNRPDRDSTLPVSLPVSIPSP